MNEWQPIHTAPQDGTPIRLCYLNPEGNEINYISESKWNKRMKGFWEGWDYIVGPSHWQII